MSKATKDQSDVGVLKKATCKSITGKSTLGYEISCTPDNSIYIRISNNTGAGFFNDEWIALNDIQRVLDKCPAGSPITSFLLQPLFKGKSSNSPAFMVAALMNERLLRVLKGKKRGHEFLDPEGFNARMQKLVSSTAKPKGASSSNRKKAVTKKAPSKKAVIKKRAAANHKTSKTG